MLPKHAEEINAKRIGVNRTVDVTSLRQSTALSDPQFAYLKEKGLRGELARQLYSLKIDEKIREVRDRVKSSFDKEANEKDLVGRDRRGIEASVEYDLRRQAGIPTRNERDDPRSPYSRENIEEGLMRRESDDGNEFAAFWDKDGELIAVFKGDKNSVASHFEDKSDRGKPTKGGTMTHSHPTEFDPYTGEVKRPFGFGFSGGDIQQHGLRELDETRAVAREGTYSFSTKGDTARIPDEIKRLMPADALARYEGSPPADKHAMAIRILAGISGEGHSLNPIDRAVRETEMKAGTRPFREVLGSKDFLVTQARLQKEMFEKFGVKWEFTPAKGYEDVARAIYTNTPTAQTDWSDTSVDQLGRGKPSAYARGVPRTTADRPVIFDAKGKRDDTVLAQYRGGNPTRLEAPPVKSAPKVTSAKRVGSAPKPTQAAKPKEAQPIKPAPAVARPTEPPKVDVVADFERRMREVKSRGALGALRKVELPRSTFGD